MRTPEGKRQVSNPYEPGTSGQKDRGEQGKTTRLSVGVLIDLKRRQQAGGQVKCWERFAETAVRYRDELDLTVHFLGDQDEVYIIADNVRYITHRPLLSTARLAFMDHMAEHTDLAPFHPRVFTHLKKYDVIHITDTGFCLAKTALRFAARSGTPLVCSIHTDIPSYARIYARQAFCRLFKNERVCRLVLNRCHFDERCAAFMAKRLDHYLKRCDWLLVSKEKDLQRVARIFPSKPVSFLRRGIDKETFHPKWRDREQLKEKFGIPPNRFLVLFVGRLNPEKNVTLLAEALRILLDRGEDVHAVIAGEGILKDAIATLLGPAVTFPGVVPQSTLASLYASADLFVFPSETEVYPNAVIEAKTSGLPVLVSPEGGAAQCIRKEGLDGLIVREKRSDAWAEAIESLRRDSTRRAHMGQEARRHIESDWPSWAEVLAHDLIPVWRATARRYYSSESHAWKGHASFPARSA